MIKESHKKAVTTVMLGLCILLVSGCERKPELGIITETTLVADSNGQITYYLVDEFSKDYYDVLELNRMANQEAQDYNSSMGRSGEENPPVQVLSVEMAQDGSQNVVLEYVFKNAAAYRDFIGLDLFYGTVAQAVAGDYNLDVSVCNTQDSTEILKEADLMGMSAWHILIVQGSMKIVPPKQAKYISLGAVAHDDGSVSPGEEAEMTYILYK